MSAQNLTSRTPPPDSITHLRARAAQSRLALRAGVWFADDTRCGSYKEALAHVLRATEILKPKPAPAAAKRKQPKPDIVVRRDGLWFIDGDGIGYDSREEALEASGPQPGNIAPIIRSSKSRGASA